MKKLAALMAVIVLCFSFSTTVSAEVDPTLGFEVYSQAVYLVNNESGMVIYQKNAEQRMFPASLTKIMTAIVAIENCEDLEGTVVTAPSYVFDLTYKMNISHADLRHNEQVRMIDLLYALILRSACEGANIIADYIGGGGESGTDKESGNIEKFVAMMNQKAKDLGATSTFFTNAHGLHDDNQHTTAKDMHLITKYAMSLPIFDTISTTNSYEMPATNKHAEPRTIKHTNTMMDQNRGGKSYYEPIKGIKTGTTDQSGRNLVSTAAKDAYSYTLVTMGAAMYYDNGDTIADNYSFIDAKSLYEWAFNNWAVRTVVKTTSIEGQVKVNLVQDKDAVSVFPAKDVERLMRKDIDLSSLQKILNIKEEIDAPVEAGQVLGTMQLKLADEVLAEVDLVSGETLERSNWLYTLRKIKEVFSSLWFKLIVITLILLVGLYVTYMVMYNKKKRKRRRTRRF